MGKLKLNKGQIAQVTSKIGHHHFEIGDIIRFTGESYESANTVDTIYVFENEVGNLTQQLFQVDFRLVFDGTKCENIISDNIYAWIDETKDGIDKCVDVINTLQQLGFDRYDSIDFINKLIEIRLDENKC